MDTTCWHMLTNVATQIEARRAWLEFVSRQIVLDAMPTQQGAHQRVLPVMTSEDATIDLKVPLGFMWWYLTWISLAELISRIYCASMKLQEHIHIWEHHMKDPSKHGPLFPMQCNFWLCSIEASSLAYEIVKPPLLWLSAKAMIPAPTCSGRAPTPSMIVPCDPEFASCLWVWRHGCAHANIKH